MRNFIIEKFNIIPLQIIKNSEHSYLIKTEKNFFLLKGSKINKEDEMVRLSCLHLSFFALPFKSNLNHFFEKYNDIYFSLYPYYEDEIILNYEVRLSFFFKALGELHSKSKFPLKMNEGYFDESIQYIDKLINKTRETIDLKMKKYEIEDYHSPYEWFYLFNYKELKKALIEAERYLTLLEEEKEKNTTLNISLLYQNYDISHILLKEEKIVSLRNLSKGNAIIDLLDSLKKIDFNKVELVFLLKEYLSLNPLENYEKEWLLSLLYIPSITFCDDEMKNIHSSLKEIHFLECVKEIDEFLFPST